MLSLEEINSAWVLATLCFVIGLALGGTVAYLAFSRHGKQRKLQEELNQLRERFTDYREQVTQHFMHTSELVREMTESYRNVYEHLATGAQYLCGSSTEIQQKLDADQQTTLPENNPDKLESDAGLAASDELSALHMPDLGVKIGKKVQADVPAENPVQH